MQVSTLGRPELEQKVFEYTQWALSVPKEQRVDIQRFWEIATAPLPSEWIKQREVGKDRNRRPIYVDYIEGGRVRELLNEACGGPRWFFVPLVREIVTGIEHRYRDNVQPDSPYVSVLGCLVIPGIGAQVGYGAKTLEGGANTQATAMAAALTSALKAAAKEFGIGLELYIEGEYDPVVDLGVTSHDEAQAYVEEAENEVAIPDFDLDQPREFQPPAEDERPEEDEDGETFELDGLVWNAREVELLKHYQKLLGVTDDPDDKDAKLNPLIKDWSMGKLESWDEITPDNIASFNRYLEASMGLDGEDTQEAIA